MWPHLFSNLIEQYVHGDSLSPGFFLMIEALFLIIPPIRKICHKFI
jgi:hypothetical protein